MRDIHHRRNFGYTQVGQVYLTISVHRIIRVGVLQQNNEYLLYE